MSDVLIRAENLSVGFRIGKGLFDKFTLKAVDNVSFHVDKAETLGLVGESGSGKTTLGRCITRLYEPTGGKIFFEGKDIASLPEKGIRPLRRKISMIFQDLALWPHMTVGQNVAFVLNGRPSSSSCRSGGPEPWKTENPTCGS